MKKETLIIVVILVVVSAGVGWYFLSKKTTAGIGTGTTGTGATGTGLIYNKDLSIATSPLAEAHLRTAAEEAAMSPEAKLQEAEMLAAIAIPVRYIDPKLNTAA